MTLLHPLGPKLSMARTPLLRELLRAVRIARHSLDTGADEGEAVDLWREREAMSRRRFVGVTAAAGAGLALGGWRIAPAPPRRGDERVVVVGAGIAGLTAAYRLRARGVNVRVYEAQDRVGGRMYSLRDFFADGQVAELGGELIDTGHTRMRALARELGMGADDFQRDDAGLARDVWFFGGRRRSEREVVAAFRPVAERIRRDLAAVGDSPTYRDAMGAERLDRMSLAEWLEGAGADGWVRDLLDVGYVTEYGLETGRQSALNFLLMVDPEPGPFRIYGESDERFHLRGGNDRIPRELARRLDDAVETAAVLEAVRGTADGGFVCTFRRGLGSVEVPATHLVLALPFTLLRRVRLDVELPAAKRRAIDELGYGTNAKLMIGFSGRPWRTRHGSNGSTLADLPYQLTWESSRLQPGRAGILTNFTGGEAGVALGRGSEAEQAARVVGELEAVFPGIGGYREGMREARFHWPTFPWTHGSYACYGPGQWTGLRGAEGERVGRLFFAGEHCSLEAQGYMEGGCETGRAVAAEVLATLGAPVPAPSASRRAEPALAG